jgi:hypothetical protein
VKADLSPLRENIKKHDTTTNNKQVPNKPFLTTIFFSGSGNRSAFMFYAKSSNGVVHGGTREMGN